jgi:hypothetical protein
MCNRAWLVIALLAMVALPACVPWRGGATCAVAISGPLAHLGVGPCLVILNVSDPADPMVVGQTAVPSPRDQGARDTLGTFRGVAVAGRYGSLGSSVVRESTWA